MKYYFSLERMEERQYAIINGEDPMPIIMVEGTPDAEEFILWDMENNELSDWWPLSRQHDVSGEPADFNSLEEAVDEYMQHEAEDVYCYIHDC